MNTFRYRLILFSLLGLFALLHTSCEKDLPIYDVQKGMISFQGKNLGTLTYSFVFKPANVLKDTLWVDVALTGYLSDVDRYYSPVQVLPNSSSDNSTSTDKQVSHAVAGKHYVSFDDPDLKPFYKIAAGERSGRMPIVLLRDPSLKTENNVLLHVTFKENEDFTLGPTSNRDRLFIISDKLVRPNLWESDGLLYYYLGSYGPVKHQFMIDVTGKLWDDDYIFKTTGIEIGKWDVDQEQLRSFQLMFARKLKEYNDAHPDNILKEENGNPVSFEGGSL